MFATFNALAPLHRWTVGEQKKLARFATIGVKPGVAFQAPADLDAAIAEGCAPGQLAADAARSVQPAVAPVPAQGRGIGR